MNLFDYVGSVLSYLVVAVGVFGTTQFDSLNASELSVLTSQVRLDRQTDKLTVEFLVYNSNIYLFYVY